MVDTSAINLLSLCQADTQLKKIANTNGGEYSGPCPFCEGEDRFSVQPNCSMGGRWFCRGCGDNRWHDAIEYVMRRDGLDFVTACRTLGVVLHDREAKPKSRDETQLVQGNTAMKREIAIEPLPEPLPDWQKAAHQFRVQCEEHLRAPEGKRAFDYLRHERHLNKISVETAGLGYNPQEYRTSWGDIEVWLPSGIVIPWVDAARRIWRINIRRLDGKTPKYREAAGGANGLYRAQYIRLGCTVVMVEGEFDALLIQQIAINSGLKIAAVATGSITRSRRLEWLARLALADRVLIAFDAEYDLEKLRNVEKAAKWWLDALRPKARRLFPLAHDITSMSKEGISLALWLAEALEA